MKTIPILIFAILSSFSLLAQESDTIQKWQMDEMMKKMEMREKELEPKKVENFSSYFQPKLIDTFFTYIQEGDYDALYENSDEQLTKVQSKIELIKYFETIERLYGELEAYKPVDYSIKNHWMSSIKVANGRYDVEFSNTEGQVFMAFNVIDSATIKLTTLQFTTDDYTQIDEIEELTKPAFSFLVSKDYTGLYQSASERFRNYTPIATYEDYMNKLDTVNFKEHKLYKNLIGVVDGKLLYTLTYDINDGNGYLSLIYNEKDEKLLLEGLNYEPKK